MSAIYEEVTLSWDGEEYTVTPTYKMVQQIEQQVSIAGLAARIDEGQPPLSHIAYVISFLLSKAGKYISPDEVYAEIVSGMDGESMRDLAAVAVSAFVPQKKSDSGSDNS